MKVLITGGAGYVGSACLRYLLAHGWDAICYDNLSQGHREAVPADRLIEGDIKDTDLLTRSLSRLRADAVIHFAAATTIDESVVDPAVHYENNVSGTLSLLNAMRRAKVERLLFSSTCATYGETDKAALTEDTPQQPCSPYARTKLAIEWMIQDFSSAYDLGFTILRYFNAAGASLDGAHGEDHTPETHLIPLVYQAASGKRPIIKVFGDDYPTADGTCIRDYVHVDDLAQAHLLALEAMDSETGKIYNVGTGHGASVLEVIQACEKAVDREIPYEVSERRPGDPPQLVADPTRITRELRRKPRYESIQDVARTAWNWHSKHPDGYRSCVTR